MQVELLEYYTSNNVMLHFSSNELSSYHWNGLLSSILLQANRAVAPKFGPLRVAQIL